MSDWRRGDLCHVTSQGHALFKVTDPGMGRPRNNIKIEAVDGVRSYSCLESALTRPAFRIGMWVRSERGDTYYRISELNALRPQYFDVMLRISDEEGLVGSAGRWSHGGGKWYPCVEPTTDGKSQQDFYYQKFLIRELTEKLREAKEAKEKSEDWAAKEVAKIGNEHSLLLEEKRRLEEELRKTKSVMQDTINQLKRQLHTDRTQKEESLAEVHTLRIRLKEALRDVEFQRSIESGLREDNERLQRWLEGVPKLKEEVRSLEISYEGACNHRDALISEVDRLNTELFLYKEKSRLKSQENKHLHALYEERVARDKAQNSKRVVM